MSKLTKLLKHPVLFFKDAKANRSIRRRYALAELDSDSIPTYVMGFNTWKHHFLLSWFPQRRMVFVKKNISVSEFNAKLRNQILRDRRSEVFIWGFKAQPYLLEFIECNQVKSWFIEDGFIRSIGLGSAKALPFSLNMDTRTPYYDSGRPSDLECLLNEYDFASSPDLLERARKLLQILVQTGLSKYNHSKSVDIQEIYGPKVKRRVLVVGQVEDDASITYGSQVAYTNNDLVMIAAIENPDAQIIYKPHPDVLNKHREEISSPDEVRHLCMVLDEQDIPLAQALETIDHVYTITSLAGFEALMRGIRVTTLGCPFYSGWGLTDDRQPNERRKRTLSLEEVFAASYLLYPKYFDPIYKIPLTAEQAVERLIKLRELTPPAGPDSMPDEDMEGAEKKEARPAKAGGTDTALAMQLIDTMQAELASLKALVGKLGKGWPT